MNSQEQAAPNHPGRMEAREIFLLEAARLEQYHRERIAEGEHDGRAGSWREIQRTRLLLDIYIKKNVGILRQARVRVAANGDDLDLKPRDGWQNPQHFLGLATGAQGEHDIA